MRGVEFADLVVHDEDAAGAEVIEQTAQPGEVGGPGNTEPEPAADDDRAVAAREVEGVEWLDVQVRSPPLALRSLAAPGDHVHGRVDTVDIESVRDPGHEEPSRSARGVESGLPDLDELTEVLDLRTVEVEVRPPSRHQTVVPRDDLVGSGVSR